MCGGCAQKRETGRIGSPSKTLDGVYFLGIIDILQRYNVKKIVESNYKATMIEKEKM